MDQKKILIVQLGRIGDLILMTPMFAAIKRNNPLHEIHLLCGRRNTEFAKTLPDITKVHTYRKTLPGLLRLLKALRAEHYECWIDPKDHYSGESALFARWANAPFAIGFNREGRRQVFTHSITKTGADIRRHFLDRNLDALVPFLGVTDVLRRPCLSEDPASAARLTAFLKDRGLARYAVVNFSTGKVYRQWPADHWIAMINAFPDTSFLINGEAADLEAVQQIVAGCPNASHYQTRSFADVISLVRHAALLISPDTSLLHLASAFDIPTVGLYLRGQWNRTMWTPLSRQQRVIIGASEDQISAIGVEAVTAAVRELSGAMA